MRWEDERYVRIYTRDTAEWVALGWEAQCLFMAILRKVDRAGILTLGKTGVRGLAGLVGAPLDLVERALPVLLDDGCVKRTDTGLVLPNFIAAQDTPLSDKARQREKRERDRARAVAEGDITKREGASRIVTQTHAESREVTPDHAGSLRAVPDHAEPTSHTQREPEPVPVAQGAADSTPDPSPTLGALRSHRVILDAAHGAPLGADAALARLAEAVDGKAIPAGIPWSWVEQAIADAARDLAAEASGAGRLTWTVVATKVARYASRAKAPSGPAVGPSRASGAPTLPPSDDERWTAATWQQARTDRNYPDGEPDPRRIAALWTAACKASMGAKPVDKWKPGPRDIVTHWIRTYLDTPQARAGGDADQGYPLAFLASRATSGEGVTLPTKADVQRPAPGVTKLSREDFAPPPPRPPVDHAALDALTAALSSRPAANGDDAAPPVRRPARMS